MLRMMAYGIPFVLASSTMALAQSEPVDKNMPGPYVGGQFSIGQASKVGNSSPGAAWLLGVDVGYGIKRDTWNRIELGAEFGTGAASFQEKDGGIDGDVSLKFIGMLKAGYGYSLGDNVFGTVRLGVGIAQASLTGKSGSGKINGGSTTGVTSLLGWDAQYPASEKLDFLFGANFRIVNLKFSGDYDSSFQLNIPSAYVGARVRL